MLDVLFIVASVAYFVLNAVVAIGFGRLMGGRQ